MGQGSIRAFLMMRAAAGLGCSFVLVVANPQLASAATKRARIDALIGDAVARHGIVAAIMQVTVDGYWNMLYAKIGAVLAPQDAPPMP